MGLIESGREIEDVKHLSFRPMKGQSLILPAITIVIILMFLWLSMNIPLLKSNEIERDVETRSEIHIMGNALDAAKLYMETSLEYSIYQACYDNLKKGGWDFIPQGKSYNNFAVWDSSSIHPNQTEFETSLENAIKSNLGYYQKSQYKFLSDYYVSLPSYTVAVFTNYDGDPQRMLVVANSEANLNIEKNQENGEYIRLEKDSSIANDDEYRVDCYGIYQKGDELYTEVKDAAESYILGLPSDDTVTKESVKAGLETAIREAEINGMVVNEWDEGDYLINFQVLDVQVAQKEVVGTVVKYSVDAKVKFTVTNTNKAQQFPVYDEVEKNVASRPLSLVFVGRFSN